MKDILKKINSKWILLFLFTFLSVGNVQAQYNEDSDSDGVPDWAEAVFDATPDDTNVTYTFEDGVISDIDINPVLDNDDLNPYDFSPEEIDYILEHPDYTLEKMLEGYELRSFEEILSDKDYIEFLKSGGETCLKDHSLEEMLEKAPGTQTNDHSVDVIREILVSDILPE